MKDIKINIEMKQQEYLKCGKQNIKTFSVALPGRSITGNKFE